MRVVGVVCRRYRPVIISFSGSGVYALTSFQRENVSTSWPSSYPAWPGAGASLIGVGVARGCIDTSAIETPSSLSLSIEPHESSECRKD